MLSKPSLLQSRSTQMPKAEMNMVPFIDVMLVLMVILLAANQSTPPSKLELPSMGQASKAPKDHVMVAVQTDGTLRLNQGPLTVSAKAPQELASAISAWALPREMPMLVRAGPQTDYGTVLAVVDQLRALGFTQVGLAVDAKRTGR